MKSTVKVKMNPAALQGLKGKAFKRMLAMSADIASAERRHAPYLNGFLVNSIRFEVVSQNEKIEVIAGGGSVPYALRRNFENFAHPQTLHYMEKGAEEVCSGNWAKKYFGGLS